jgi:High potential iron-sulfur protein
MPTRRTFLRLTSLGLLSARFVPSEAGDRLVPGQYPQKAAGYVLDRTKADAKMFNLKGPAPPCKACDKFLAGAGDEWGSCSKWNKEVAAHGWCSQFEAKKAR